MKTKDIGREEPADPLFGIKSKWHMVAALQENPCNPRSGERCIKFVWGKQVEGQAIVASTSRIPNERFVTRAQLQDTHYTSLFNAVGISDSLINQARGYFSQGKTNIVRLPRSTEGPTPQMAAQSLPFGQF